ncbi:MAG: DUF4271 domain-containing protein [Chitinophagaceae bacterium]|nr:DUF4271 domain-containing protein [Chitinophagaceae bacterium]
MGLKYLAALIVFLSLSAVLFAQAPDSTLTTADSARISDSVRQVQKAKDSLLVIAQQHINRAADSIRKVVITRRKNAIAAFQEALKTHPYLKFAAQPERQTISLRKIENRDSIFYFVVALVLYVALMRLFFYKYFTTMFTLFFRATLRQQQLREQLLQAPLPALLMNFFFVVSLATYCTFLAIHFDMPFANNFWTTLGWGVMIIAAIYLIKFLFLNIVGWIFGISNVTDTYIFIVFLINKMIGIFLLPVIALLAFPTPALLPVMLTVSYILVGGMLFYRFIISYRPVRSEIKLNRFHFFLYLCAFEIAPLLLIYKVLITFVDRSQ